MNTFNFSGKATTDLTANELKKKLSQFFKDNGVKVTDLYVGTGAPPPPPQNPPPGGQGGGD